MKKIILTALLAFASISSAFADTTQFYEKAVKKVSKAQGTNVRLYVNSSYHVAKMWKEFPHTDFYQRVACYIGWGGAESGFETDYVHFNIPGKPYPGLKGLKVKKFSVDYAWSGLNEDNVENTYAVAKALQDGRTLTTGDMYRMGLHPSLMVEIKKVLRIPKNLQLYHIDVSTAIEARKQYDVQRKAGVKPKQIRIHIDYNEDTQDKIDSVLLYRSIEEFDRYLRGWPPGSWHSEAFDICQDIINE